MRNLLITLALILITQKAYSFERSFRIDETAPITDGYAVAWGIPGKNLDFEKIDGLPPSEVENVLDFSLIQNYVVDIQTNTILTQVRDSEGPVVFSIAGMHFGNHYFVSLDKLAIQGLDYPFDVVAVTENFKWVNAISTILWVDRSKFPLQTTEINAEQTMDLLKAKLRLSILPKNLDLFDDGAENIMKVETSYLDKVGKVNIITFDYTIPKQDVNSLKVVTTVKMKYENGTIVPYVLSVKQNQY